MEEVECLRNVGQLKFYFIRENIVTKNRSTVAFATAIASPILGGITQLTGILTFFSSW